MSLVEEEITDHHRRESVVLMRFLASDGLRGISSVIYYFSLPACLPLCVRLSFADEYCSYNCIPNGVSHPGCEGLNRCQVSETGSRRGFLGACLFLQNENSLCIRLHAINAEWDAQKRRQGSIPDFTESCLLFHGIRQKQPGARYSGKRMETRILPCQAGR